MVQHSLKGRWSSVGCPCGRLAAQFTTYQVLVVKFCTPVVEVCWVASLITGCHHSAETVLWFSTDWPVLLSKLNGLWNTHRRCYTLCDQRFCCHCIVISKAQIKFIDVYLTSAVWVVWRSMSGETGGLRGYRNQKIAWFWSGHEADRQPAATWPLTVSSWPTELQPFHLLNSHHTSEVVWTGICSQSWQHIY